ncbi:hypothetical protein H072_11115 [Dactylellina haptotyla CBS 200.50]|uniref:Uncharacterized protein n=1 Tax=Dactylellina haptotyla (strain CBS 200.50) TaxID=1284197 RepID=S7ZYI1_DACHA|nr:hypothetical protein H072_11115 [Dactylellina haptotyla CBS 200.50]
MPASVIDGRVSKRRKASSTVDVYNPSSILKSGNYEKEIRFFRFVCKYNVKQIREVMEAIFNINATQRDYQNYLSREDFRYYLKQEEWEQIIGYFLACEESNLRILVKLNGRYLDRDTVKRSLIRRGLLDMGTKIMQSQRNTLFNPSVPHSFGSVEACGLVHSGALRHEVPASILNHGPFSNFVRVWLEASYQGCRKTGNDFFRIFESWNSGVDTLWNVFYLLSNGILSVAELDDFLEEAGLEHSTARESSFHITRSETTPRTFLKQFLALNTVSVQLAAENILPLLILRCDWDLISHILKIHGSSSIKWYTGLIELAQNVYLGYLYHTQEDVLRLSRKYQNNHQSSLNFLAYGLEIYQPFAQTELEAGLLIHHAVCRQWIQVDTMLMLLPPETSWKEAERGLEIIFGSSILEYDQDRGFNTKTRLDLGFRRNLHILTMEAVLRNDIPKVAVLIRYCKLDLTKEQLELLNYCSSGVTDSSEIFVGDIIGNDVFGDLIFKATSEASDPECRRGEFQILDLLPISFALRSSMLREFLIEFFRIKCGAYGWSMGSILSEAYFHIIHRVEFRDRLRSREHQKTGLTMKQRWQNVLGDHESIWNNLHTAIWLNDFHELKRLIQLGIDLNNENWSGEPPLFTAILISRRSYTRRLNRGGRKLGISSDLLFEIEIFKTLLASANDNSISYLCKPSEFFVFSSRFLNAVQNKCLASIGIEWETRFESVDDDCEPYYDWHSEFAWENCSDEDMEIASVSSIPTSETGDDEEDEQPIDLEKRYGDPGYFSVLLGELIRTNPSKHSQKYQRYREYIESLIKNSGGFTHQFDCSLDPGTWAGYFTPITILQQLALCGDPSLLESFALCCPEMFSDQLQKIYKNSPSPLQFAAWRKSLQCIEILVKNGADPCELAIENIWKFSAASSQKLGGGRTALYLAVEGGSFEITKYLVEQGADIHARALPNPEYSLEARRPKEKVKHIDENEALSVLELAVKLGRVDFVDLFLSTNIAARDVALSAAQKYRRVGMADWIEHKWKGKRKPLSSGANPDAADRKQKLQEKMKRKTQALDRIQQYIPSVHGDLSTISAPTPLLAPKSVIEYPSTVALHHNLFLQPTSQPSPLDRSISIFKNYICTLTTQAEGCHIDNTQDGNIPTRVNPNKSLKKPLNPFLGELFLARATSTGSPPSSATEILCEQVGHHPPTTASYLSNKTAGISVQAYLRQSASFAPTTCGIIIQQTGHALTCISKYNEWHLASFPTLKVRGLLSFGGGGRYTEYSGPCAIVSSSGYVTRIMFEEEGGKKGGIKERFLGFGGGGGEGRLERRISGTISRWREGDNGSDSDGGNREEKPVVSISGSWGGDIIIVNNENGKREVFRPSEVPTGEIHTKPTEEQDIWESNKAWQATKDALRKGDWKTATEEKRKIEEWQRDLRRKEEKEGKVWSPKFFSTVENCERFQSLAGVIEAEQRRRMGGGAIWRYHASVRAESNLPT